MEKTNLQVSGPMMLLWPWWKAKEAARGEHIDQDTDAMKISPRDVPVPPYLPLEIVDKILREACKGPPSGTKRPVLAACALVCKSWLPLSRSLLYHSVIVKNGHNAYTPQHPGTLVPEALLQQSHLLAFTRSLFIRVFVISQTIQPLPSVEVEGSQGCIRIPDFFFLLAHTPRLRYLELSLQDAPYKKVSFEPHMLHWLSSLSLPIEALSVNARMLHPSPFVYDFVNAWLTIQALCVRRLQSDGSSPKKPSLNLRELRLLLTSDATDIEWFLPPPPLNQQSNLRFLELYEIPEEALAVSVLSVHGPNVSALTLMCLPNFEVAHLFPRLEELILLGEFWKSPLFAFPRT